MPIYEYVCRECGHSFETLVARWNEAVECPSCRSASPEKQLSTFAMSGADTGSGPGAAGGACCGGGCRCRP